MGVHVFPALHIFLRDGGAVLLDFDFQIVQNFNLHHIYIFISNISATHVQTEQFNLVLISAAMMGGLGGFLCFNCNKAKIFMGDTGSLALGGLIGVLAVFSGLELYLSILGIMFVLSALSDIIQVLHYKRTKKRVFLMAPLHHHFEKKGVHENRIVVIYIFITMAISVFSIAMTLAVR